MDNQKKTNKELENESARINNDSETKFTPSALKILSKKSHILILAAIVIVVLVTGGYFYYSYSAGQLRADKENELKAIAVLKTNQLIQWHKERIVDAKVISESSFFVKGIEEWLSQKNRKPLSADILEILNSAKTNFGYEDIFLVSARGDILLSNIQSEKKCETQILPDILEASGSGKITFTDFYFCPLHNKIHYDIIAPIKNNSNRIIADLIFRVDPNDFLYPLIQSWPTPSKTAEVFLIKKDGDSVLYLNELRHQKNTALQLRTPLTRTDLPGAQAILGKTGIFDGKDYRGTDIVGWLNHVPGTDWFLVSKVDKDEIFAGLNFRASIVFIVIVLLILALTIGMVWVYYYRQMNVYRNLWQVQEEFRATLYSIGDGVISTDINGFIVNMNPIAETFCGWELKDALGKPLTEVFKIINSDTRKVVDNPVNLVLKNGEIVGLANHTILISKNGNEYQIADSAAPIKNKDGEISGVVLVFSDVTQKYAAEKAISDSEKFLKETQIIAQLGTYTLDINTGIWSSSEILDEIFGIETNHDKSMDGLVSIIHPDWQKTMNAYFIEEVIGKKLKFDKEYQIIRKANNEIRWVHGTGKLEFDEQGNPVRMLGTIHDITERKRAEAELIEREVQYRNLANSSLALIWTSGTDKLCNYFNQTWLKFTGRTFEQEQGNGWAEGVHPDDFDQCLNTYVTAFDKREPFEMEYRLRHVSGEYRWLLDLGSPNYNSLGEFMGYIGHCFDITERKQAEEAIKSIAKVYSSATGILLFENICRHISTTLNVSYAFIGELMPDEKIRVIAGIGNGEILNTFDYDLENTPCENVIGQSICIYPTNVQRLFPKDQLLVEMNIDSYVGIPLFDSFGKAIGIIVLLDCKPIDNPEVYTSFLQIFSERVATEMTRLKAEEELQKSNEKLLSFFEDDISADFLSTPDGEIIFCNKTFVELFGFASKEEVMLYNAKNLYKNSTERDKYLALLLANKRVENYECAYVTKNGINIFGLINAVGEFDKAGELIQIKGYIIDITERKIAEDGLRKLSRAVEQSPASVVITNPKGDIEFVNNKFCSLTGYSEEDVIGKNPRILNSGYHDKTFYKNLWDTILSGNEWQGEFHNKKKNGELFWESTIITSLVNQNGDITHFIAIREDITEKKKMLDELIKAKEKAEESDKLKSAFLANMSHEIRTPMNGILGFSDLLKNPDLTGEKQQKYIAIIEKSGARMLNIINDIVDISKIEAGLMTLDIKESDINEQIEYIYTFFKPEVEAKGMNLLVKTSLPSKEAIIKTDREKVFAILTNLVKNAIKYSEKGVIELGYILKTVSEPVELEFYVKDTGIGIPKDRQEAIFERFIQADITDKMARQGAGLGLSITKAYVEMLGGKIWVESQEGIGSTFYFTLACNGEPKEKKLVGNSVTLQEEKVEINPEVSGLKILIAEDDETSEMLISIKVEEFSKEILIARNGFEAVEICRNNPDTDLILMDIQMPVMSGYEATRQIRQFNKDVVIIAQTAFGLSADRNKAIEAGCNDYIAKPIVKAELLELIQKYFIK